MNEPRIRTALAALAACLLCGAPAPADTDGVRARSWPQWRGPLATGEAPHADPPVRWSEDANVRFKVDLPGKGLSSPIVWGDRVFLTTAVRTEKTVDPEVVAAAEKDLPEWRREQGVPPAHVVRFVVLALDRATGRTLWSRTVREAAPHEGLHMDASWASASAVTDGKVVIAHFGSAGTYALDFDGKVLWERDLGDMRTRRGFGEGASPALHGDTVVIGWDHEGPSFVVALDVGTGKTRWKRERDEPTSWSTPVVVEHGGKAQVILAATERTRGYDLDTGDVVWEAGGMTVNTIPTPVHADGRVFVMSGFRGNMLQAIDLAKAKGEVTDAPALAWTYDRDTPYVPSPLLVDGRLYFLKHNSGILSVLDVRTGAPVYSRQRVEGIDNAYASPVAAAGRVYVVGRGGATAVLADGPEYELLAVNRLDDRFDASPALAGSDLFLRGHERLYCLAVAP